MRLHHQMSGRAGRKGIDDVGNMDKFDSFVFDLDNFDQQTNLNLQMFFCKL